MSGIAIMAPTEEIYEQAQQILENTEHHVKILKHTTIETVIMETRKAIADGVNIVIARGHQAKEIAEFTKIPIVEMSMTAQEIGIMVVKAKRLIGKPYPKIAILAWDGMICDITHFRMLYEVDIKLFSMTSHTEVPQLVEAAIAEGMEFIIGGEKSVACARSQGIPALELDTTGESIEVALKNAESMYNMSELEQHNSAQLSTVLDSSFNGIIKVSQNGVILMTNRVMCQILNKEMKEIVGKALQEILPGLDIGLLDQILCGQIENYSTFVNTGNQSLVVVMETIKVEDGVAGAIISCNRMKRLELKDEATLKEQYLHGYVAGENLDKLVNVKPDLKPAVDKAKIYAQSKNPILLEGHSIADTEALAGGIHNYSLRKNGPFVVVDIDGMSEEEQIKNLFGSLGNNGKEGETGAAFAANYGTLVILGIHKLTFACQYYLLRIIRHKQLKSYNIGDENTARLYVRIIGGTNQNLYECMKNGKIRKEFYYAIQALKISIPPLQERHNDVASLLDVYLQEYLNQYSRYHILSAGARQQILQYSWDCDDIQLEAFVERMVLSVGKRTITEEFVKGLLKEMYGEADDFAAGAISEAGQDEDEYEQLIFVLEQYNGSRVLTAKALGISTTTLWRRLKKYNIV